MDISPGPGWKRGKDGRFYAHLFTFADFPGAQAVAVVFKTLAVLILLSGAGSAISAAKLLHDNGTTGGNEAAIVAGIVTGTIIAASSMAFFGYVLQLLIAIHFDVRYAESSQTAEDMKS